MRILRSLLSKISCKLKLTAPVTILHNCATAIVRLDAAEILRPVATPHKLNKLLTDSSNAKKIQDILHLLTLFLRERRFVTNVTGTRTLKIIEKIL